MNKKWLVFLGSGRFQISSIFKAKSLGYSIISFDMDIHAPGFNISDLFFNIDIKNYKLILEKISQLKIRPLKYISICNEAGIQSEIILNYLNMNSVSNVNEYLNKYLFLTNKYHQRKLFKKNINFQLPRFQIFNFKNKDNYFNFKNKVILKPTDSSGSRGIIVKNKLSKININDFSYVKKYSSDRKVLIEDYINGTEFAVEAFNYNKKVEIILINKKIKRKGTSNTVAEAYFAMTIKDRLFRKIKMATEEILRNLSLLRKGYFHLEYIIDKNENIYLVEFAGRGPGFHVFDKFIPFLTGYNIVENNLNFLLNKKIKQFNYKNNLYGLMYFFTSKSRKDEVQIKLNIKEKLNNINYEFGLFNNNKNNIKNKFTDEDRLGYLMIKNKNKKKLIENFNLMKKLIKIY